ncbi:MAG: S24/S26 family peptidase [Dermatophilaceae bacterium]
MSRFRTRIWVVSTRTTLTQLTNRRPRTLLAWLPRPALVRVRGRSMLPTYRTGDVLLVIRGASPRIGRAAIVRLPPDRDGAPRPLAVKRVTGRDPGDAGRWWVDSDNPAEGVTSFDIGSLAEADIVAVVLGRMSIRRSHDEGR